MKLSSSRCGCGAIFQPTVRTQRACTACTVRKHQAAATLAMDLRVNEVPHELDDVHGIDACGSGDRYPGQNDEETGNPYIRYGEWAGHDDMVDAMVFGPQLERIKERLAAKKKADFAACFKPRPGQVWQQADAGQIMKDLQEAFRLGKEATAQVYPTVTGRFPHPLNSGYEYTVEDLRAGQRSLQQEREADFYERLDAASEELEEYIREHRNPYGNKDPGTMHRLQLDIITWLTTHGWDRAEAYQQTDGPMFRCCATRAGKSGYFWLQVAPA